VSNVIVEDQWVSPADLTFNAWNPNRMDDYMYRKAVQSIRSFGFVNPVIVREVDHGFEVIDGEHRVKAARDLGIDRIPIWDLGPITDPVAKQLTIVLNETRGQADREKLGELLRDVLSTEDSARVLEVLPYQQQDLAALINIGEFDWDQIENLAKEHASTERSRWVERIYRMPPEAAEALDSAIEAVTNEQDVPDWKALVLICNEFVWKREGS
jgi:ParB-like chromosome segregation protein Spo0J